MMRSTHNAVYPLLALNLSQYSLGAVAVGFFRLSRAEREKVVYYGMILVAIGLVF